MQKQLGLRSLEVEGFVSLAGPTSANGKPTNPRPSSDAGGGSYGSFANLKITAEKLVKEQASVKTDLEMTHAKLKKATEQINMFETKLQQAVNENVKLKVKQTEDSKLWQGLDSKVSSTKTLCDQLTETLQQLASQAERAEEDKKVFEETLGKNPKALDEFNGLLHDTSAKLERAEQSIMSGKQEMLRIKQEKAEIISAEKEKAEKLIREMENECNEKIFENKRESERCLTRLKEKDDTVVARIQQDNEHMESTLRAYHKEELQRIRSQAENELKERLSSLRQEHQAQINTVNAQHEEDCQKLQDELELQKSKEEKQRALLQLKWKVMGEHQQVDQERRDSYVRKESQAQLAGPETKRKDFRFIGCLLLIIGFMFLPSAEARKVAQISDPYFCSNHDLLSRNIDSACMPMQPQPMCCELLVPVLDFHGCLCNLMKDGTKIDNFLTKYISCGGQHPDFVEETKNCSSLLPNKPALLPNKPAPAPEVAEVVIRRSKSKNIFSVRWLLVLLLIVVIGGLLYLFARGVKRKLDAGRVAPQIPEAELTGGVAVHARQTADDQIRNQHVEIPIVDDVPFLGPMTRSRFKSLQD